MTTWWVIAGIIFLAAVVGLSIWMDAKVANNKKPKVVGTAGHKDGKSVAKSNSIVSDKSFKGDLAQGADHEVERIFDDHFREELRNRGRLHFEKIIGENAMFLQQDLRLTTSQLNDYMKQEITAKLKEEFTKYEESITDAKDLAIDAIEKTKLAIDEERTALVTQLQHDFAEEKAREIKRFEENMTDVINHYLVAAIGQEIDLSNQLQYIIANLEANKTAIIEDLNNGA